MLRRAMRFVADLHVHSYLSRATSKELNLEQLHRCAQLKGISVVGTGDFTHPRWLAELREKLVPCDGGLFSLRDDLARAVDERVPAACRAPVRFMLSVEISSIYKRGDKVRKVHNLVYVPDLETAAKVATRLSRIGNIESDGRPILGLDSRDLLEIVLESSPDAYLVPAHIWTPWFSALGAQSGFDALTECFGDLSEHIFAAETGLSSDPAMNWRISGLDRLALVSSSDAHSPEKLGREASVFDCDLSYFGVRDALRDRREGFLGTLEFFPEEGKYHFDGHRKCGVVLSPREVKEKGDTCSVCGKRLTGGVMSRVEQLADREEGFRPEGAKPFQSLVPLTEVIGEVMGAGPGTVGVRRAYERLLQQIGPELSLLLDAPLEDVSRAGPPLLAEAMRRVRAGEVHAEAGFDGEYGVVKVFDDDERRRLLTQQSFGFAFGKVKSDAPLLEAEPLAQPVEIALEIEEAAQSRPRPLGASGLNAQQSMAVDHGEGPLLIVAGPGTGKTRTLAHRIARLVEGGVSPRAITAITFTRRAAGELRERLASLLGGDAERVDTTTFHSLGLALLKAFPEGAGLRAAFTLLDEPARREAIDGAAVAVGEKASSKVAQAISRAKARLAGAEACEPGVRAVFAAYESALEARGAVDFDDLVARPVRLLETSEAALAFARERCMHLFVDEYQDINAAQYRLLQLLAPPLASTNLCAVGDPDQAIYGFRGSDPSYFGRFEGDYPGSRIVTLTQSYRSPASVVAAATHVIEKSPGRARRSLEALTARSGPVFRHGCASERDEADLIAGEIERAVGGTSLLTGDSGQEDGADDTLLAFHDIAVIVRLSAQAEPIEEALGRAGIPYHRMGDDSLAARPFVGDTLASLGRLVQAAEGASLRALESGAPGLLKSALDAGEIELAREIGRRPVAEIVERLGAVGAQDPRRRRATELLATIALPFGSDVPAFLGAAALMREADVRLEPQKVALLTLHASKGLEFPLVFLAGCENGLLPLALPGLLDVDTEEERRLLYVGMTRAKRRLVLTTARRRVLLGRAMENGPCPFLEGLPPGLLSELRVKGRRRRPKQLSLL